MKIAIVDDEQKWLETAKQQTVNYWKKDAKVCIYHDGKSFLEAKEVFDIVLMDIEMPEMDGFDTIKEYQNRKGKGLILILTTHTEMSRKGYQVDAFRYIDKLQMQEELKEAFDSARFRLRQERFVSIALKNAGKIEIPIKKIIYFESELRKVILHTDEGDYTCTETLSKLNEKLEEDGFFMPHKPYLVNLEWIKSFNEKEIVMKNGDELMMSRRRYGECKERYYEWKFKIASR